MANPIVQVNVSISQPPTPSTLQKTGALISQGGTVLAAQTTGLLTQLSDLTPLLAVPVNLASLTWSNAYGGQVTATASAAHGVPVGQKFVTTIAGCVPSGYNGTFTAISTGADTFTYQVTANPGTSPATTAGTYTPAGVGDLLAMATTFFGQGSSQVVYVLELGAGGADSGVSALTAFINSSPQEFYSYLVPRSWDGNSNFLSLIAQFEANNAKTYFFVTTTLATYQLYTEQMKDVIALIEAPATGVWPSNVLTNLVWASGQVTATTTSAHGVAPGQYFTIQGCTPTGYNGTFVALPGSTGTTLIYALATDPGAIAVEGVLLQSIYASAGVPPMEFTHATDFYTSLNYAPSSTNKVTPFEYQILFGVTPFPTRGNAAVISALIQANINYVGTGQEGGISNTILYGGNTMDGNPFNFWYSVDWMQINLELNLANAVINGSNNPVNPLYYNQDGINRLAAVATRTGVSAISFGLALGTPVQVGLPQSDFINNLNLGKYNGQLVVNAQPFVSYLTLNPSNYKIGLYGGLSMVYTPLRGFDKIIFNVNVTQFVAGGV